MGWIWGSCFLPKSWMLFHNPKPHPTTVFYFCCISCTTMESGWCSRILFVLSFTVYPIQKGWSDTGRNSKQTNRIMASSVFLFTFVRQMQSAFAITVACKHQISKRIMSKCLLKPSFGDATMVVNWYNRSDILYFCVTSYNFLAVYIFITQT